MLKFDWLPHSPIAPFSRVRVVQINDVSKNFLNELYFTPKRVRVLLWLFSPIPPPPSKFLGNFYKNNLKLVEFEMKFISNQEVNFHWNSLAFEQTFFAHFEHKSKTTRVKLISFLCYLTLI